MNMNLYNPQYYAHRNDALQDVIRNDNLEAFKKFIVDFLPDEIDVSMYQDYTLHYAARLICINIPTMPMSDKEKAVEWLRNTKIEKEYVDEIAYISEVTKNTKI
jgi:hypothetical protein